MKSSSSLRYLLTVLLAWGYLSVHSQTIIIWDEFDSYQVGDKVAATSPEWNTWDGLDGGTQDATISNEESLSPEQSMLMDAESRMLVENDTIYEQGKIRAHWQVYVPDGNSARFGLLQKIESAGFLWGSDVFLNSNGIGQVNPNGLEAATFTFNFDEWVKVEHFVDMDDDFAELWIDNDLVYSWTWSQGNTGTNNSKTFQSAAFRDGATSGKYFVDDVRIEGDGITATHERGNLPPLEVYPNPASDAIIVESKEVFIEEVVLYDVGGRLIKSAVSDSGAHRAKLSVNEVPPGLYVLKIKSSGVWQPKRVLIQR